MPLRLLRAGALAAALVASVGYAQEPSGPRPDEQRPATGEPSGPGWDSELSAAVAAIGGHTTYRISASDSTGSVESELEFPLGGVLAALRGQLASHRDASRRRWIFEASAMLSPAGSAGTLKDSDWLDGSVETAPAPDGLGLTPHAGKDIYSESTADLHALVLEARAAYELEPSPGFHLAPLVGVLYQRFTYDVRDVVQVGYGPYQAGFSGTVLGPVLDYEVSYRAVYAGARGELERGRFSATAELWYSPIASAEDRDDHKIRSKLSTTDATGTAWQAGLGARFALGSADALQAQVSLVRFSVSGTQFQRFYAGPNAGLSGTIGSDLTSSRETLMITWAHRL